MTKQEAREYVRPSRYNTLKMARSAAQNGEKMRRVFKDKDSELYLVVTMREGEVLLGRGYKELWPWESKRK